MKFDKSAAYSAVTFGSVFVAVGVGIDLLQDEMPNYFQTIASGLLGAILLYFMNPWLRSRSDIDA